MKILAADIGGTSSRFASFDVAQGAPKILAERWLETRAAANFLQLLEQVQDTEIGTLEQYTGMVLAIAGPVEEGKRCQPPNISWGIDLDQVARQISLPPTVLINDFLAQAYSTVSPIAREAKVILPAQVKAGQLKAGATVAVIGPGTGLGQAFLLPSSAGQYQGGASEGGHAAFAPETRQDWELVEFLKERVRNSYVSWEDLVSGRGLANIHEFLTGEVLTPAAVAEKFAPGSETLDLAARILGMRCRNFVLEVLSLGGLFIAGGVAAKNPILLENEEFRRAFYNCKVHLEVLRQVPVYLLQNEKSGLWGAMWYGHSIWRGNAMSG